MTTPPKPKILDVTIRDGGYLIDHQYSPEHVARITKGLEEAGVEFAEVSHGCGIGSKAMGHPAQVDDEELLGAAKTAAPQLKFSIIIGNTDLSLALLPGLVDYFDIGRIGVNVDAVKGIDKLVKKIKKFNKTVSLQLMRTHGRPPEFVAKTAKMAEDLGVDIIYIVDTYGSLRPEDTKNYVEAVKAATKAQIGFHGHNHIGMAMSNTFAAWKAGATWLDASLMGVGRDAGNTNLEILTALFEMEGVPLGFNLKKLSEVTQQEILPLFKHPPFSRYVDLVCSAERLDFSPSGFLETCAQYLGLSLENFLMQLKNKMGDHVMASDPHLNAVFLDHGKNFETFLKEFKGAST